MQNDNLKIITKENHRSELFSMMKKGLGAVEIVSPWIVDSNTVAAIGAINAGVSITVTFRWPRADDHPDLYNTVLLREFLDASNVELKCIGEPYSLHAKVYLVEGYAALVTSANLTRMGFPEGAKGNIEMGVMISDEDLVSEIGEKLKNLDSRLVSTKDIERIEDWKNQLKIWSKSIKEDFERPGPPEPPAITANAVQDALEYCVKVHVIDGFSHAKRGMGRKAFFLNLGKSKENYPVRILTSAPNQNPPSGYEVDYHFNLSRRDVSMWHGGHKSKISGVVLVPIQIVDGIRKFSSSHQMAFVPFSYLFEKGSFPISSFLKSKGRKATTLSLSRKENGKWIFRVPPLKKLELDAESSLNSKSKMTKYRNSWVKK